MRPNSTAWFAVALFLVAACTTMATPNDSFAQESATPIVIGETFTMHSDILDEDRLVMVHRPRGYDQTQARYPVMYLLDGDQHFHHTTGIIDFLTRNGDMPEMIVVALPNTDRTRDLTPPVSTPDERFPTAGGADHFLSFITDELKPLVQNRYRTQPFDVLVGHSFGGLFAMHALLSNPDAFNAYVSISPSLWWNEKAPVAMAEEIFNDRPEQRGFLYLTVGNEGGDMLASVWRVAGILEEKAPENFEWHFEHMKNETHGSIPHRTTLQALEALYDGWGVGSIAGLAANGEKALPMLDEHFASLSDRYGYEVIAPEATVNILGYSLVGQEFVDEGIAVFKRNAAFYPDSPNVYDSLGDGYDAAEMFKEARESYEKACEMGEAANDPNTNIYCANATRLAEKMSAM